MEHRDTRRRFEQWARNPTCQANTLSAVHNVPMADVAKSEGAKPTMGQSPFAIARGQTFERSLYRSEGRAMYQGLREAGVVSETASGLVDLRLRMNGGRLKSLDDALAATADLLRDVARGRSAGPWLVAGATVRVPGGVMLPEAILVLDALVILRNEKPPTLVVGEIKTYPDRGGYTDPKELATARAQLGVYVHGLQLVIDELKVTGQLRVSMEGFLVLTRPGFNRPSVRAREDLRYQAERARRGFQLLRDAAAGLPKGSGHAGIPEIRTADINYCEACVSFCDRAALCRAKAVEAGDGAALGDDVARFLGSIPLQRAIELMGDGKPQTEAERDLETPHCRNRRTESLGMTSDEVVRRLRSFEKGRPLPVGETLRVRRLDPAQTLVLAFVKMGGESAPWGVAFGRPGKPPRVLTVAEPRTRDDVASMMLEFAPVLLTHVHHPQFSSFGPDPEARVPPFQLWVPNDSHLEMLHHLAYAYTFTKFGELARWQRLRMLGRACGWLFRESRRPGQTIAMSAAQGLTSAYTFPVETIRQGHLGFLLAWLQAKGSGEARAAAAAEAEALPVSTSLDPALERDELLPYVEMFNEARGSGNTAQLERAKRRIDKVLAEELTRRFALTEAAIEILRADRRRENKGMQILERESMNEHRLQYRRLERNQDDAEDGPAFTPSPETDRYPAAAASRFYVHEASQEQLDTLLVHDDRELQAQLVANGEAIAGTIIEVSDEGEGRKTRPIWVVESQGELPIRVREDSELCVVGLPARKVRVREIKKTADQRYRFELAVTGLPTVPRDNDGSILPAASPKLKRRKVVLVKPSMDQIARRKSGMIWNRDVPGAWLTHDVPKVLDAHLPRGVGENLGEIENKPR